MSTMVQTYAHVIFIIFCSALCIYFIFMFIVTIIIIRIIIDIIIVIVILIIIIFIVTPVRKSFCKKRMDRDVS